MNPHSASAGKYVPAEVYNNGLPTQLPRWQGWAKDAKKKLDELMQHDAA